MSASPHIYVDILNDVSLTEHAGESTEARRVMILRGVSAIPSIMENAKMFPGLPLPGDVLDAQTDPEMILESRGFRVIDWKKDQGVAKVRIELVYRRQRPEPVTPIRGGTAVEQIVREVDKNGTPISVTYTPPEGEAITQGGHITPLVPRSTITIESIERVDEPQIVINAWLGKVNSDLWHAGRPKTWLIVRADWEEVDAFSDPRVHRFTWDFEHRVEKWEPITVAYKDPATGEQPPDLQENVGRKDIEWYDAVDFRLKFPYGRRQPR